MFAHRLRLRVGVVCHLHLDHAGREGPEAIVVHDVGGPVITVVVRGAQARLDAGLIRLAEMEFEFWMALNIGAPRPFNACCTVSTCLFNRHQLLVDHLLHCIRRAVCRRENEHLLEAIE